MSVASGSLLFMWFVADLLFHSVEIARRLIVKFSHARAFFLEDGDPKLLRDVVI